MSAGNSRSEGLPPATDQLQAKLNRLLTVSTRELPRGTLVTLVGEVDLATAARAEHAVRRAEAANENVVLDLRRVSFIESTGLKMMIAADGRLRKRGGRLVVLEGSRQVRRLLELTGLTERLSVVDESLLPVGWPATELNPLPAAAGPTQPAQVSPY